MMKNLAALAMAAAVLFSGKAQADEKLECGIYGKVGYVMADSMLDMTFREVIGMTTGTRPDILAEVSNAIIKAVSDAEMTHMASMPQLEQELLGEAAGQNAMAILMQGQASTADEVRRTLASQCVADGVDQIYANQQSIRDAMGLPEGYN